MAALCKMRFDVDQAFRFFSRGQEGKLAESQKLLKHNNACVITQDEGKAKTTIGD
jgi:hypothetical protein